MDTIATSTPPTETRGSFLENHSMTEGFIRFQKQSAAGPLSSAGAGKSLVSDAIQPLANAIHARLESQGKTHIASKVIPVVGVDVSAYIIVRSVLNHVLKQQVVGVVAVEIADLMMDELRYRRFKQMAPGLYDFKVKRFNTNHYDHKRKSLNHAMRTAMVTDAEGVEGHMATEDLSLTDSQRLALGVWCINLVVVATGLVDITTKRAFERGKVVTKKRIVAPQETLDWLAQRHEAMQLLWPVAFPMVEQPLAWGPGVTGGYRHALKGKYPLIRGLSRSQQRQTATIPMPKVYEAINAIQNTAWTINREVADVFTEVVQRGGGVAGVPVVVEEEMPMRPVERDDFERQRKIDRRAKRLGEPIAERSAEFLTYLRTWKEWKTKAGQAKDRNHTVKYDRTAMLLVQSTMDLYREDPALYFVYNVDFRGRVYPVAGTLLSPQGNDMAKGLLTFANPRELGGEGRRYLAQHGASCLDTHGGVKFATLTIKDRVQWIEEHSAMLCQVAQDPMGTRWWSAAPKDGGAESPFCFLAFCIEWHRMIQWERAGHHSDTFRSSLPCAQDGSCNGIQHFSAMLRDAVGGHAVNLTPQPLPQDIYRQVMLETLRLLEVTAGDPALHADTTRICHMRARQRKTVTRTRVTPGEGALAMLWLTSGLVTRKLVKRPVMTYPYGSRAFGFAQQLQQYVQHMGVDGEDSTRQYAAAQAHFGPTLKPAMQYLAGVIMQSLESTVVAASAAMRWLKDSARLVASAGQRVTWTVPGTGFVVTQHYMVTKERQVDTMLLGRIYKPVIHSATEVPNATKQANAVAPNVVHSLDAAALMLTVRMASIDGIESFAMIHDSYGAPAGDCAVLARCTRMAFVNLYTQHDVVESLHRQLLAQVPDPKVKDMPKMPSMGTLDLSGVHAADFFFM